MLLKNFVEQRLHAKTFKRNCSIFCYFLTIRIVSIFARFFCYCNSIFRLTFWNVVRCLIKCVFLICVFSMRICFCKTYFQQFLKKKTLKRFSKMYFKKICIMFSSFINSHFEITFFAIDHVMICRIIIIEIFHYVYF